jgi:hypothetical protein
MSTTEEFSKQELNEMLALADYFEVELAKFKHDTKGENIIQILLRGHLYIEHELRQILNKNLVNPHALDSLRFIETAKMVYAIGAINSEIFNIVKKINKLRNDIAHKLDFVLTEDRIKELEDCLEGSLKHSYLRNSKDNATTTDKLKVYIFWAWQEIVAYKLPHSTREKVKIASQV